MDDTDNLLEIPVTYKGEELSFTGKLILSGYIHKIQVDVTGQQVIFEPDEERNYRVIIDQSQLEKGVQLDVALLQAIAQVLESVIK
ncbi:hypothetical protein [Adhaeribacter rhizoryzae]|uniref:Uncharacterized protein n=1 Tax=Adhaeribacter rhizoryzae TaxID=2607907 RepID=A0A5M6DK05_9BACT|nr:hypothetical protein [Adhaeribacter rhizoryzae]KAA5547841.1 hypothetical protein F0145_07835 [Adhaeribacter rhizoryzae]